MSFRNLAALPAVVVALLLSACGSSDEGARIVSFHADPSEVTAGSSSTLRWITEGATRLQLQDGEGKPIAIEGAGKGSVKVRPMETATYVLTATGEDGEEVQASTKVEVIASPPRIERFAAAPGVIGKGGTAVLWWIVTGADSIVIADDEGAELTLAAGQSRVEVAPERTTVYTLTATGNGVDRATATVEIGDGPEVTFTATPGEVDAGDPVTLAWTTRNATRIQIREGERNVHDTNVPSGEIRERPQQNTTYQLVATGPAGETTRSVAVVVRPSIEFTVVTPGPTRVGRTVEVSWRIGAATSATIHGEGELLHTIARNEITGGRAALQVGPSGSFELVAKGEGTESRATATIALTEAPIIEALEVPPMVSAGPGAPADVDVRWQADGATSLELAATPGGAIAVPDGATEVTVPLEETTTFRLVARNEHGTASRAATVGVVPFPTIETFAAMPARVGVGHAVELQWHAIGGAHANLFRDGEHVHSDSSVEASDPPQISGRFSDVVVADTTYEIEVFNEIFGKVSRTLQVKVGAPIIGGFSASVDAVAPGATFDLEWENEGGTSLEIVDSTGAAVCATADLERIAAGSCSVQAGVALGDSTYTLRVRDPGDGMDERMVVVRVTDGPIVRSFVASSAEVNAQTPVHLVWEVAS
ncbi:MAG TPA: hypothetical protein VGD74_01545, partial [Vulgatibacter sp.]